MCGAFRTLRSVRCIRGFIVLLERKRGLLQHGMSEQTRAKNIYTYTSSYSQKEKKKLEWCSGIWGPDRSPGGLQILYISSIISVLEEVLSARSPGLIDSWHHSPKSKNVCRTSVHPAIFSKRLASAGSGWPWTKFSLTCMCLNCERKPQPHTHEENMHTPLHHRAAHLLNTDR